MRLRALPGKLLTLLVVVAALLSIGLAAVQTAPGRAFLARRLTSWFSGDPSRWISIQGIEGIIPVDVRIARVSVGDQLGEWMAMEDVHIVWPFGQLIRGNAGLTLLDIARVTIARSPTIPLAASPAWPQPELPLAIDTFIARRVTLNVREKGDPAVFTLEGRAARGQVSMALQLLQLAGLPITASADLALRGSPPALQASARFSEAAGGPIGRRLGLPATRALTGTLSGDGPLIGWSGALTADAAEAGRLEATLRIVEGRGFATIARGKLFEPRLPPAFGLLAPELGRQLDFALTLGRAPDGDLWLDSFQAMSPKASLAGGAHLDSSSAQWVATASLDLAEAGPAGPVRAGRSRMVLRATGSPTSMAMARTTWTAENVVAGSLTASSASAELSLVSTGTSFPATGMARFAGSGTLESPRYAGAELTPGPAARWTAAATVPATGPVLIERIELQSDGLDLALSGSWPAGHPTPSAKLRAVVPDLSRIPALRTRGVAGAVTATGTIAGDLRAMTARAELSGELARPGPLPAWLDQALGARLRFDSDVSLERGDRLRFHKVELRSARGHLLASGSTSLATGGIDAAWKLDIARLRPGPRPVAGSLRAEGTLAGTAAAPAVAARLTAREFPVRDRSIDEISGRFDVRPRGGKGTGSIDLRARYGKTELRLASGVAVSAASVDFSGLSIESGGGTLSGNVSIARDSALLSGQLAGRFPDLSRPASFAGYDVRGSARVTAKLSVGRGAQSVEGELALDGVSGELGSARSARVAVDLSGLPARPSGTATLRAQDVSRAGLAAGGVELTARAEGTRIGFDARVTRMTTASIDVTASGALSMGEGTRHIDATARLARVPLDALSPGTSGWLSAEATVRGPLASPDATYTIQAREARLPGRPGERLPFSELVASGRVTGGRAATDITLSGLTRAPVRGNLSFPATLSLLPPSLAIPDDGAVSGSVTADADLARLGAMTGADIHLLSGRAQADLSVGGTVSRPTAAGRVEIAGGRYENARNGTVLQELQLDLRASGREVRIERATATDGREGRMTASGSIVFDPARLFPLQAEVSLDRMLVLRRDEIRATASGSVALTGTLQQPVLAGRLTVRPVEITVPNHLPADIPTLEVVEVGGDRGTPPTTPPAPVPPFTSRVSLDVELDLPGPIAARGRGLDSEWKGSLRVNGRGDRPSLVGQIVSTRGTFSAMARRFTIRQGIVTFAGGWPIDPSLDVAAETRSRDLQVQVNVRGTALRPELTFTSTPPLPSDEILARMVFGNIAGGAATSQNLQLGGTLTTAARQGLLGLAGSGLGLTTLSLDRRDAGFGRSLELGTRLDEDTYLEVVRGLEDQGNLFRIEKEVSPGVRVQTEFGTNTPNAFGVFYRRDY